MRVAHLVPILCVLLTASAVRAAEAPAAADVDKLAGEATAAYSEFMQVTFPERIQLELLGRTISSGGAWKLAATSRAMAGRFAAISAREDALRGAIEDYQGSDWEARYGSTGLWRRLKAEICRAAMFECETKYWQAMAAKEPEATTLLESASARIATLQGEFRSGELKLLDARILCAVAKDRSGGLAILDEICAGRDDTVVLAARLKRYRVKDPRDNEELGRIWTAVKADKDAGDELWMQVGFEGWRQGRRGWLEDVVKRWPQSRELLGQCVLAEVESRMATDGVAWMGPYAADMAADAASDGIEGHRTVIAKMAAVKEYRSAGVLYAMGLALEKTEPLKAAAYFSDASRMMNGPDAIRVAGRAARLAYDEFRKDRSCCSEAAPVIRRYLELMPQPGPEMMYCHYLMTAECGDANEATGLLEKIAAGPASQYQRAASHDLAVARANKALQAGRVTEAASLLAAGLDAASGHDEPMAADIAERFLDRWEEYEGKDAASAGLKDCAALTKYCLAWANGPERSRVRSLAAETAIISGGTAEPPTGDEYSSRCIARLSMAGGDWQGAGSLWGRICQKTIAESEGDQRPWAWWQARYYQLYCWSKGKEATKEELARRVEVTLSSCGPVPPLWEKKLRAMQPAASTR